MITTHPSRWRCAAAGTLTAIVCMLATTGTAHAQSLDELLDIEPAQPPAQQPSASPDKPSDDAAPQQPKPLITPPGDAGDPSKAFNRALERMREASSRLGDELDTGLATQRLQESALELMDQVIAQAMRQQQEQQQQQQSSPQQQNQQARQQQNGSDQNAQQSQGQRPASGSMQARSQSSQASQGQTSPGSPADAQAGKPIEETGDQWGTLPPRLRQQLLQSMSERFSPIYQQMTEAYYKKLAQEATP